MQRYTHQNPNFTPGTRLSRLSVRTGQESLEDFYRDLFSASGPEHNQQRLFQLLDEDVADGAAARGRAEALEHLDRAFRRIDAWTYQGDFLPQADRAELKRRVAHNLLAARPGLVLAAQDDAHPDTDPGILRQVQAEHAACRQGTALFAISWNAPATPGQNETSADNSTSGPLEGILQDIFGQGGESGPLDDDLGDEFDLKGAKTYWTVQPNPGACEKCQAMAGKVFTEKPERPHPNCKCLIQEHKVRTREKSISGELEGFDAYAAHSFSGGWRFEISVTNQGPFLWPGIHIMTNHAPHQGSNIFLGDTQVFKFSAKGELPIPWKVQLLLRGADNTKLTYNIRYTETLDES
jgi:hypothetical protein